MLVARGTNTFHLIQLLLYLRVIAQWYGWGGHFVYITHTLLHDFYCHRWDTKKLFNWYCLVFVLRTVIISLLGLLVMQTWNFIVNTFVFFCCDSGILIFFYLLQGTLFYGTYHCVVLFVSGKAAVVSVLSLDANLRSLLPFVESTGW